MQDTFYRRIGIRLDLWLSLYLIPPGVPYRYSCAFPSCARVFPTKWDNYYKRVSDQFPACVRLRTSVPRRNPSVIRASPHRHGQLP